MSKNNTSGLMIALAGLGVAGLMYFYHSKTSVEANDIELET